MKTRLTKAAVKAALTPKSEAEAVALITETIKAQTVVEEAVALRDRALAEAAQAIEERYGYDALIAANQTTIARNVELVEAWADQNPDTFGKLKSRTLGPATIGWRRGQWKTQLKAKLKWADVINFLQGCIFAAREDQASANPDAETQDLGALASRFIRVVTEADKEAMIAARDEAEAKALLDTAGVLITQDERFFVEPHREGQADPTLTTPAA